MFTGIISDIAEVKGSNQTADGLIINFSRPSNWQDLKLGESVSTDGVCLTVADLQPSEYSCLLVPETLEKTTFGKLVPKHVNLERALSVNGRLDGHFVQGHVDGVGKVVRVDRSDGYHLFIEFNSRFSNLLIPKGSIAVNGVSLTIADLQDNIFSIALIPHTLESTTLGDLGTDSVINLEFDMIGKYIVNFMERTK